jgi:hypothetical protein
VTVIIEVSYRDGMGKKSGLLASTRSMMHPDMEHNNDPQEQYRVENATWQQWPHIT